MIEKVHGDLKYTTEDQRLRAMDYFRDCLKTAEETPGEAEWFPVRMIVTYLDALGLELRVVKKGTITATIRDIGKLEPRIRDID